MPKPSKIMVVDDTPANIELLNDVLSAKGYSVSGVPSGPLALKVVEIFKPDLILLDIMMPELDGYAVADKFKSVSETKNIPIIFVTAKAEAEEIELGFKHGAADYITKPIKAEEVWARVANQMQIIELKQKQDYFTRQLSIQENRYRAILDSSSDPMITVAPPGKISWINSAAERLLGAPDYELSGRNFIDFISNDDPESYKACFDLETFGAGETDSLLSAGRFNLDIKSLSNDTSPMSLKISKVGLNYPLFLCHFHYR